MRSDGGGAGAWLGFIDLAGQCPWLLHHHTSKRWHTSRGEGGKGGSEGTGIGRCLILESLKLRCRVCHVATLGVKSSGLALLRLSEAFLAMLCIPRQVHLPKVPSYVIPHRDSSLVYWYDTVYSRRQSKLSPAFQLPSSSKHLCLPAGNCVDCGHNGGSSWTANRVVPI